MHDLRRLGTALAATLFLLLPLRVDAQSVVDAESRWVVDGRAGVGLPVGDLADFQDPGFAAGLGIGYKVHPRVTLRADGDLEALSGADVGGSDEFVDTNLWHYTGGVEVGLTDPTETPWNVTANVGAGATTFSFDLEPTAGTAEDTQTYFSTRGGLHAGYLVSSRIEIFAGGDAHLVFVDEEDFESEPGEPPILEDTAWSIPLTAGIRVHF